MFFPHVSSGALHPPFCTATVFAWNTKLPEFMHPFSAHACVLGAVAVSATDVIDWRVCCFTGPRVTVAQSSGGLVWDVWRFPSGTAVCCCQSVAVATDTQQPMVLTQGWLCASHVAVHKNGAVYCVTQFPAYWIVLQDCLWIPSRLRCFPKGLLGVLIHIICPIHIPTCPLLSHSHTHLPCTGMR
jgi:hypothetical protein